MPVASLKLRALIRLLWQSPFFGDSFPVNLNEDKLFLLFETIYARISEILPPLLQQGMPESSPEQARQTFDEIAPKSIAFCAAISAGEIEDVERLTSAVAAIAISYWADQNIDRGDEATLTAVRLLNGQGKAKKIADSVESRLQALRQIRHFSKNVSDCADDLPFVLRAIEQDVPLDDAVLYSIGRLFLRSPKETFWRKYAQEIAQRQINCSGLMSAGSILYALYRRHQPRLPSLSEIDAHPVLQQLIRQTCNPAVRIFDDAGDAKIDSGESPRWGKFNLNIFNQPRPLFVHHFLILSGLPESSPQYLQASSLFALPLEERRVQLAKFYRDLTRERLANLPADLWERYDVFLSLVKRILEASFVNLAGDMFLADNRPSMELDQDYLLKIRQMQLLPLERI